MLLVIYAVGCMAIAWNTVRPKLSHHRSTPASYHLAFDKVPLHSADGTRLSGWYIPAVDHPKGVIILCHGVDSTMSDMLWKATVLHRQGFSTFVFDFRGRGESDGALCTLGYRETDDLLAAVRYVKSRTDAKALLLGVYGESQGGAVALMATARCSDIRAVVAESPYARLDHAVDNHFRSVFGAVGVIAARPVAWIGEAMIHRRSRDVSPMDEIARIAPRPLMLIQDEEDRLCPPSETQILLRAAGEPKQYWSVRSAGHVQAEIAAPDEFARRIPAFYRSSLSH